MELIVLALAGWFVAAVAIAYALAQQGQVRWFRKQLEERQEHRQRIERVEAGLPEIKLPDPVEDRPPPGIQMAIDEAIDAWDSASTQAGKREDVLAWRQEGRDWEWIVQQLRDDLA